MAQGPTADPFFCDQYCAALVNNPGTKLERLRLRHKDIDSDIEDEDDSEVEDDLDEEENDQEEAAEPKPDVSERNLDLHGNHGRASGFDSAILAKVENLLKWNVQRRTCPPLFAAIGSAETDASRKQCLVEALEAVDIPVVFEYIMANENNLIELIQ